MPSGTLQVYTALAENAAPLPGVTVLVLNEAGTQIARLTTNDVGSAPELVLTAPDEAYSLDEANTTVRPYAVYQLRAEMTGFQTIELEGVQVFAGHQTVARLQFLPAARTLPEVEPETIPEHPLFAGNGGSGPAPIGQCADARVLSEVVVPKKITVHLARPAVNAANVTVSFQDYIANVASSEVYPTWPEQALRANILAQISLALNRIWTEWYPSRGYSFNITNSPGVDQAYVRGRTVFAVMERLTAELFNTYVRRTGDTEPYYTEYCDGKSVTCPGMKQWGTVDRAKEGKSALEILRYYYGSRVQLVTTNNIASIPQSYPGSPLRRGSTGTAVNVLQKQLSRIAKDYPSFGKPAITGTFDEATENSVKKFQKQFSLTVDGVVGKATWYKISYIYVSVKDLAELTSEGETFTGAQSAGAWPGTVLRRGSTGRSVEQVQFWLSSLAQFDSDLPSVRVDGSFGAATERAVKAFQKSEGLTQDGVVGQMTWQELYAKWVNAQSDAGGTAYPGTALRTGSRGNAVRLVQFWLRLAAENYTGLSNVTVDGSFGSGTASAVRAFQRLFGLTADGVVGAGTWAKLNEVGLAVANNLVGQNIQPGQFVTTLREGSTGTPVRALQYNLRLLAAYYRDVPTVTVDGTFGAATRRAVIAWQEHAGLTVDGVVGRLTWQSIYDSAQQVSASGPAVTARAPDTPEETLKVGDSGQKIRILSQILEFLAQFLPEITPSGLTDTFDDALETTVRSAQQTLGRTVTGEVTPADWLAFYRAALSLGAVNPASAAPEPQEVWPGAALTLGSSGPAVLQVQQWLNEIAAQDCSASFVPETGEFDTATQTALEAWQIANNITPLGVVDDSVWKQLKADANIS